MLLERGIVISYETIRCRANKFGPGYAGRLHRKQSSPSDIWHLDEVVVTIGGKKHWLWRAVDQAGYVLSERVQSRGNTKAARRLLIRLMKNQGCLPKRIVTDKLRSYGAAKRRAMPDRFRAHRIVLAAFHIGLHVGRRPLPDLRPVRHWLRCSI